MQRPQRARPHRLVPGERHEAGVWAGTAGRRAGALRRQIAPEGATGNGCRSHGPRRRQEWLPACSVSHLRVLAVKQLWNFVSVILDHHMSCFHMRSFSILIVSHGDPLQILQAVLNGTKENSSFLNEVTDQKKERPDSTMCCHSTVSFHSSQESCAEFCDLLQP